MRLGSAATFARGQRAVLRVARRSTSHPCANNRVTPGHRSVPRFALQRCGGSGIERVRGEKRPHVKPRLSRAVSEGRSHRATPPREATPFEAFAAEGTAQMFAATGDVIALRGEGADGTGAEAGTLRAGFGKGPRRLARRAAAVPPAAPGRRDSCARAPSLGG